MEDITIQEKDESLIELIENYDYALPKQGQYFEGRVLEVSDHMIFVDIGVKRDAVVPSSELNRLDDDVLEEISVGGQVPVCVIQEPTLGRDLLVSIDKGLAKADWERAQRCFDTQEVIRLEITGWNNGGVLVRFGRLTGFVPNSLMPDIRKIHSPARREQVKQAKINSQINLKFVEVDLEQQRLVLSAIAAQDEQRAQLLAEISVGDVITGLVTNLVSFGAFVDLGGIDGLVHISKLAWEQVNHPSEVIKVGDRVEVLVESVDLEKKRIGLNRKELLPNPIMQYQEAHQPGDRVEGVVDNVREYGLFVKLTHGVTGLVHISEMPPIEPETMFQEFQKGDPILVQIISIDTVGNRISLSTRDIPAEDRLAWMSAHPGVQSRFRISKEETALEGGE